MHMPKSVLVSSRDTKAIEYFLFPLPALFEASCLRVCFRFFGLKFFASVFQLLITIVTSTSAFKLVTVYAIQTVC